MKKIVTICLVSVLCGCCCYTKITKKLDHSKDYLHTENYQAAQVKLADGMNANKFGDYYPVPDVQDENSKVVPTKTPPKMPVLKQKRADKPSNTNTVVSTSSKAATKEVS